MKFWLIDDMAVLMRNNSCNLVEQIIDQVKKSPRKMTVGRLATAVRSSPLTVFIVANNEPRLTVTLPLSRVVSASVVKLKKDNQ